MLPGILLLTLFGCLNALDGATVESGLNFGAALFFSGLLYSQRYVLRAVHLCRISLLALAVLFYYISMVGGASGFKVLWIYLFPLAVFFILGNREGLAWSLSFFAGLVFLLSDLNTQIPAYRYPDDFRLRIHWVYLTIVVMMFMYETVRRFYQEGLHQKQRQLIDEKQKLAEANATIMATTHHIREREATLNSIFRAAPAGICLVKNGVIEKVNAQLSRMLGYREEAMVSRSMATPVYGCRCTCPVRARPASNGPPKRNRAHRMRLAAQQRQDADRSCLRHAGGCLPTGRRDDHRFPGYDGT